MYRIVKQRNKFYAIKVDITTEEEQENIEIFVNEGTPVLLVDTLKDAEVFDIDTQDIEIVE